MDEHGKAELENQFGRGVYTADTLVSSGVFTPQEQEVSSRMMPPSARDNSHSTSIEGAIGAQLARGSLHGDKQGSATSTAAGGVDRTALMDSLPNSIAKQVSFNGRMWRDRLVCPPADV